MISKITQELLDIIKKDKYKSFADILQTADNVIMFSLPGKEDQYKLTITRIKTR